MKKTLLFIGGGVVLLVSSLVGLALYGMNKSEREKNQMKTAAARRARHAAKEELEPDVVENENSNSNEQESN